MKKSILPITALLLLAAMLRMIWLDRTEIGAQTSWIVVTPEDAAVRHVREMITADFTLTGNSIEAAQSIALEDQVLVLVQYSGIRRGGGVDICVTVLETRKTLLNGWKVFNGAGLCHEVKPANSIPVTTGSSRGQAARQSPGYSTTYGLVRDPQITKVVVTWEDGHIQPVEVQKCTYFAVREGDVGWKEVVAFNFQNEIVYATDQKTSGNSEDVNVHVIGRTPFGIDQASWLYQTINVRILYELRQWMPAALLSEPPVA
jgi:hypothetical protein